MHQAVQRYLAITVLSALAMPVQADQLSGGLHPVLNAGLTFGGDTIATTQYTNGTSEDIKAGGLIQLGGGVLWQATDLPLATQLTVNYHVDDTTASNGNATFDRVPIELAFFYTGVDKWRFGGGARFVQTPKYRSHIDGVSDKALNFKNTTGALVEVGYGFTPHMWVNVRYVSERYKPTTFTNNGVTTDVSGSPSYDGSHVGVNFMYAF
ncbi:MAG TPA: hypothetical protein VIF82_09070 [Burkholderiaceae bacterium]|jgi:hypothetical protein